MESANGFVENKEKWSEALQCLAESELNEKIDVKEKALRSLRKKIAKLEQQGLKTPNDDRFLLLFLRAKKFNKDKAADLLWNYYNVRRGCKNMFRQFYPHAIRQVFQNDVVVPLTRILPLRPLAILVRVEKWDTQTITLEDLFKGMLMTLDATVREDETNQVTGYNFIFDMAGLTMYHISQFTPMFARRAMAMFENVFPARVKGLHHVNVPSLVESVFNVFRPFLSDKMKKRFVLTSSPDYLLDSYLIEEIPEYLGGELDLGSCAKAWRSKILSMETHQQFMDCAMYGICVQEDTEL